MSKQAQQRAMSGGHRGRFGSAVKLALLIGLVCWAAGRLVRPRNPPSPHGSGYGLPPANTGNPLLDWLSGGNQQKVVLAKCLLVQPRVLLMDEPTRGIDVGSKAEIYELMNRLSGEGIGILMVSSELPELLAMCDRILVLCEGRLTAEFRRGEATQELILDAETSREAVLAHAG